MKSVRFDLVENIISNRENAGIKHDLYNLLYFQNLFSHKARFF